MIIKNIRYVIREKTTGYYLAEEGDNYPYGGLCEDIEYAVFWLDAEDVERYRKNSLDEPDEFEVAKVYITYEIELL